MQLKIDGDDYPPRCNPETICANGKGKQELCCCYGYKSKLCWMHYDLCNQNCNQPSFLTISPN